MNYFRVPSQKSWEFEVRFVRSGKIASLRDLGEVAIGDVRNTWRNERSWLVAKPVSSYFSNFGKAEGLDDRGTLCEWTRSSSVEDWKHDPIGAVEGVGINTFQYLRMMGGVDTVTFDKIVRKVVEKILEEAKAQMPIEGELELIKAIERMAELSEHRLREFFYYSNKLIHCLALTSLFRFFEN